MPNPFVIHSRLLGSPLTPVLVTLTKSRGLRSVTWIETLGEYPQQDRHGKERPRRLDEGQPFGVVASNVQCAPPCRSAATARGGTKNVTATGKSLGCGSL